MKITNSSIVDTHFVLMNNQQQKNMLSNQKAEKIYSVKNKIPKWLRLLIFNPFNPFYSVFLQYKASRKKNGDIIKIPPLFPFAIDFYKYCLSEKIDFDTLEYYPQEDEFEIKDFIENRLMSLTPGYIQKAKNSAQQNILKELQELRNKVVKDGDWYKLQLDDNEYYLPDNKFEEHTYIHHYGLNKLSPSIWDYIRGKDFLDVGAYVGDATIFFQKMYKPARIFAYEPVIENVKKLHAVVNKNKADNVIVVAKGLSNETADMDIFFDSDYPSGCSINKNIGEGRERKETISITTIDEECRDRNVGLIKMDIEGAEYSAISGGLETIKRDKPVLLISLYHTGKDFFEIPPMLKQAVPEYQFRFLNLEIMNPFSEKILVAYPDI